MWLHNSKWSAPSLAFPLSMQYHLQYAKIVIKNCSVEIFRKKATLAFLLLRWPNRDEFLGVEVGGGGGGVSLQLGNLLVNISKKPVNGKFSTEYLILLHCVLQ